MINVEQLAFSYEAKQPLFQGIDLAVDRGMLYGVIGPDGSGKSTLMKLLSTTLPPQMGSISVYGMKMGRENHKIRSILGYVPEISYLHDDLTVDEQLHSIAMLRGIPWKRALSNMGAIYEEIHGAINRKTGDLSGGMHQKLAICAAILHRPQVLLLDEPTLGIDLPSRLALWEMLGGLKARGMTVVVTTSDMEDAQHCSEISMLDKGKIILSGSNDAIISSYREMLFEIEQYAHGDPFMLMDRISRMDEIAACYLKQGKVCFRIKDGENVEKVIDEISECGLNEIRRISTSKVTIEDCYIKMFKNGRV